MSKSWSPGVVILGAGASARMGRPKLLLPWGGTTVLGWLVGEWRRLGMGQIVVVVAGDGSPILDELDRLGIPSRRRVPNPDPSRGMFSSIQCAAAWTGWDPWVSHVALSLGDQPLVRRETLARLMVVARESPGILWQPSRGGRPRHPVILPAADWTQLMAPGVATLRSFLEGRGDRRRLVELDDPGLDLDLDVPADYERALAMWGRNQFGS